MKRRELLGGAAMMFAGMPWAKAKAPAAFDADDLRHAEKLRALGLADTRAWALLQQLCTDVGARPAGSAADAKAVTWAQGALRGLNLAQVRAESVPLRVWQRGPASATLLSAGKPQTLVMAALGNSVATPDEGIEAELAWYPDLAALMAEDPATSRARGRIVFIDQKMQRSRDGSGYSPAVGARSMGPIEAARRGALAVGIRSIGTSGGTERAAVAHTGATRYDLSLPRIPAFAVSVPDAEAIARQQAAGGSLRLKLQLQAQGDVEAVTHNVIAEVPGTDLKDEIVLISGHLDSWDLGQGAQDNGAGVAIASAAAGVIMAAGLAPRRTIRVVLFANEENGFDGARAYGERYQHVVHQMVGESDFGAGPVWQLNHRVRPEALPLFEQMAGVLAPLGVRWADEAGADARTGRNRGSPGPDAALLMRRHRWPAVALGQDGTHYFDVHHTEDDTLDRIDPRTLPQNVACWAVAAWLAAQAPLGFGPAPA